MIYHIAENTDWESCADSNVYAPADYEDDSFVHCSDFHQVEGIANFLFQGREDVILLEIDPTRLASQTIYENLEGGTERFPHIYGAIDKSAIRRILPLTCASQPQYPSHEIEYSEGNNENTLCQP